VLDVVVTCLPHSDEIKSFPQVRGFYLAKHLAHLGLAAEFRPLPLADVTARVLICSEYQSPVDYFQRELEPRLRDVEADRMFCMIANSLRKDRSHFSREHCEWFAARGGVLVHLPAEEFEPYEHWIGLGVDRDVVAANAATERNRVLFDFPKSWDEDASSTFDVNLLAAARSRLSDARFVGSGPADSPLRPLFDDWVEYGQPHAAYTRAVLDGVYAFVPGWGETMGLPVAEAQTVGACVVWSKYQVPESMLCPEADVRYEAGNAGSLVDALRTARSRDSALIAAQAAARFDFYAVSRRTRKAIGL